MLDVIVDIVVDAIGTILTRRKGSNQPQRRHSPTASSGHDGPPLASDDNTNIRALQDAGRKRPRRRDDRDDIDVLRAGP